MTMGPVAPPTDPMVIRLYDEIKEMRGDVASMASDVRNLATKIEPVVSQVSDHENRMRAVEHDYVTSAELEKVKTAATAEIEALRTELTTLQRFRWAATPIVGALSAGVGAAVAKVMSGH